MTLWIGMRAAASPCGFVSRASSVLGRGAFVRRREISRRALSDARTPMSFGASSRRGRDAFFACGSALSPELRDMLSVPPLAASSTDPDEGWGFTDDGLLDWRRSPPASFSSRDPARAAEALKGLARASLRRLRAPPPTRADTAAHARLLRNLRARLPEDPYLVLALSLAVIERRCADLHGSNPRGASPLLSEVLASDRLRNALVAGCSGSETPPRDGLRASDPDATSALRATLDPACLNLRNVVWHGFIAPPDASPELAALAWTLARSIPGDSSPNPDADADSGRFSRDLSRCDAEVHARVPRTRRVRLARDTVASRVRILLESSSFLDAGWRPAVADAADALLHRGDDARFVAVAAPALEHALRRDFARANDAPEVTRARPGSYFATLDGFGQAKVHDVLLHPERPDGSPNALPNTIPTHVRAAMEDLFMRDRGPGLRAAYAHGAVALEPRGAANDDDETEGACARLLLLAIAEMCAARHARDEENRRNDGDPDAGGAAESLRVYAAESLRVDAAESLRAEGVAMTEFAPLFHPATRLREATRAATEATTTLAPPAPRFTHATTPREDDEGTTRVEVFDAAGGADRRARVAFRVKTAHAENDAKGEAAIIDAVRAVLNAAGGDETAGTLAARFLGEESELASEESASEESASAESASAATPQPPPQPPPPPPGPAPCAECLRAAADEVRASALAYASWIDRLTGATERREARSNHRRQLAALLREQRRVAAGLAATLVAIEALGGRPSGSGSDDGAAFLAAARRLLTHAASTRAACESGRAAEAAKAAGALWEVRAGEAVLREIVSASAARRAGTREARE